VENYLLLVFLQGCSLKIPPLTKPSPWTAEYPENVQNRLLIYYREDGLSNRKCASAGTNREMGRKKRQE
jgi:hypothetical protein